MKKFEAVKAEKMAGRLAERVIRCRDIQYGWCITVQPDADGLNDDGEQCMRLLCWASEEDAEGDSGRLAIGQLMWVA